MPGYSREPRDEPYLLYNGERLTPEFSDVDEGEFRNINVVKLLEGQARVDLFDANFFGDDFLGSVDVLESEAGQGQQIKEIRSEDSAYTLFYRVQSISAIVNRRTAPPVTR